MFRKTVIRFLVIFTLCGTGCSVSRKIADSGEDRVDINRIILSAYKKNLTDLGFYIQKGKILVEEDKSKVNFIYSVKYARKDLYIISIRALNGFEALRIFINNDSILINNRIDREILYGNRNDFERITGIPIEFLKICFGDIVDYSKGKIHSINNIRNDIIISGTINGIQTISAINKENYRLSYMKLSNIDTNETITIEYKKYRGVNYVIPGETIIYDSKRAVQIIIKNQKFIIPWYGDIEFTPGVNFKRRHI